ncbi:unnamed protein product [Paramecium primaurelia]|uniref:V-type proton ATPase subunit a n=1 Tax=Paramecium primaurelia TaxID=5886 RepID=A0A8S1MC54_PARPR|nr:unnamed protein product [Paramecium primaurelia]
MSFFRSKKMKYYSLVIPRESAWVVMNELARLGQLHFVDYDPQLPMINRPFANYVKRCDDSLFKLSCLELLLKEFKKNLNYCENVEELLDYFSQVQYDRMKPGHTYFDELESEIEQKKIQIQEQSANLQNLLDRVNIITEQQLVLENAKEILGQSMFQQQTPHNPNDYQQLKFGQLIGVIEKEEEVRFKRIIFRVTKGNAWVQIKDLNNQEIDNSMRQSFHLNQNNTSSPRCLYVIVYPGADESSSLKMKLLKVCDSFNRQRIEYPNSMDELQRKMMELNQQLLEVKNLIEMSKQQLEQSLDELVLQKQGCNCSYFEYMRLYVLKEKYLYVNLNYLTMRGSIFTGYFWLPEGLEIIVEEKLRNAMKNNRDHYPTGQIQEIKPYSTTPPTYFNLNEVTMPFQEIVNTYGIPRYQEVNPGLFTIITFPFLFGVMFADIAHGFMLFLCGLYIIFWKNYLLKQTDSMFNLMIPFRYLIVLMGFFAFYNGFIYNDYLSISLNLFGSCYSPEKQEWKRESKDCVYPFGVDPVWQASGSSLNFMNSYKMKLSVILGVIHMLFGILMKGVNTLYFKNYLDFFCEFIPQLLFMICTFGWMDFIIIVKWLNTYENNTDPSIIETMINQVLKPFDKPVYPVFPNEAEFQLHLTQILTLIAVICIPWMLLPKPLILGSKNDKHKVNMSDSQYQPLVLEKQVSEQDDDNNQQFHNDLQNAANLKSFSEQTNEQHDSGEIWVHQMIETIEFVLGGISNTASYLRLWALSLAHGQLAEVFYDMCLAGKLDIGGILGGLLGGYFYIVFALLTFGVLMTMDVMECFLHALRLHWVEFQNKFYKADGYLFNGYSYKKILNDNLKQSNSK